MVQAQFPQQRNESEPSKEEIAKLEEDGSKIAIPKVVFDGQCEHSYVFTGIDSDGHGNARCVKCPMGKIFNIDEKEVIDGKLVDKNA